MFRFNENWHLLDVCWNAKSWGYCDEQKPSAIKCNENVRLTVYLESFPRLILMIEDLH